MSALANGCRTCDLLARRQALGYDGQLEERQLPHELIGRNSAAYPLENIDVLKDVGYFIAPIPEQFGGLGVESVTQALDGHRLR